jgi:hypothetical protein
MGEAVNAALLGITDPQRVHQDQIARMTGCQEPRLNGRKDLVRFEHSATIAGDCDRVAIPDALSAFACRDFDHADL